MVFICRSTHHATILLFGCMQVVAVRELSTARQILQVLDETNAPAQDEISPSISPLPPTNSSTADEEKNSSTSSTDKNDEWSTSLPGTRLNLAGRQRMYSQKMAKDALLIYLDTNAQISLWQLEDTRKKFEYVNHALVHGSHELLIKPATEPDLAAQMDVVQAIWNPFNEVLINTVGTGNITLSDVMVIVSLEGSLLRELNKFVGLVEKVNVASAPGGGSHQDTSVALVMSAINQAGAQRMRSQKMMVKYAMCVANINYDQSLAALHATVEQFDKVHTGLLEGSEELFLPTATDPQVVKRGLDANPRIVIVWLGQVSALWEGSNGFRATVTKTPSMFRLPRLVQDNIPILGRYNVVVGLIEKTSSAPPAPVAPPPHPAFPHDSHNAGTQRIELIIGGTAILIAFMGMCTLVYFYHRYLTLRGNVKEVTAMQSDGRNRTSQLK